MSIKYKLLLAFVALAVISLLLSSFISIHSISSRLKELENRRALSAMDLAESLLYDEVTQANKLANFLSEEKEVMESLDNPDHLGIVLELKRFMFPFANVKILNDKLEELASYRGSSTPCVQEDPGKDELLRKSQESHYAIAGIFSQKGSLCIKAVSPIFDETTLEIKGFVLLSYPINAEFADRMKARTKADILLYSLDGPITSTVMDDYGRRSFPRIGLEEISRLAERSRGAVIGDISGANYFLVFRPVRDYFDNRVGYLGVAVDLTALAEAKRISEQNILISGAAIFVIILFLSAYIGRRLTSPLAELTRGAIEISEGNLDYSIDVRSRDETMLLASAFNAMARSLRRQRSEILRLKSFFENIIENSPTAIVACDAKGNVLTWNKSAASFFQKSSEEVINRNLFEAVPSVPSVIKESFFTTLVEGKQAKHEELRIDVDGREKIANIILYPLDIYDERVVVLHIEDITEKTELEKELIHSRRLGALGETLSQFAHEFNNLITSMLGFIAVVKYYTKDEAILSRIEVVEELARRSADLGRNILDFSKKMEVVEEVMDISSMINTVVRIFEKTLPSNITVKVGLPPEPLFIRGRKSHLFLALLNILINAKEAIQEAGREEGLISISVDKVYLSSHRSHFARISVADNGIGMDDETMSRIFQPYFSTKKGKGTGLGLSTVRKIIGEHRGIINVESQKGKGSIFHILLPLEERSPIEEKKVAKESFEKVFSTVLIVDDEQVVLEFLGEFLTAHGYDVLLVNTPSKAREVFARRAGDIDLLIVDYSLQEIDGKTLALQLLEKKPQLKVILTSGFAKISLDGFPEGRAALLMKPFSPSDLISVIEGLLRENKGAEA